MRIVRFLALLFVAVLLASTAQAVAFLPVFTANVDIIEPGKHFYLSVVSPEEGMASLLLMGDDADGMYTLMTEYPVRAGVNVILWRGDSAEGETVPAGEYVLSVYVEAYEEESEQSLEEEPGDSQPETLIEPDAEPPSSEGPPALLYGVSQSSVYLTTRGMDITFAIREAAELTVTLLDGDGIPMRELVTMQVGEGSMSYKWEGLLDGERVPIGPYALKLAVRGMDSLEVAEETVAFDVMPVSQPYSEIQDGTYWSMTPGELDDAYIWDVLTQPIYVFNDHETHPSGHTYLYENPDGTGNRVAQLHARSQGVHLIGGINEHGYILVEAFSNYDPIFRPKTAEELEHAFDIKRGYILAKDLKRVEVSQEIAFLVDKLTQRMYIFIEGERVTELVISTGEQTSTKMFRETIAGEFITISYVGGFWSNEIYSDLAIRYNGGSLIHEVPCTISEDGTRSYAPFEKYLGVKKSAGCIRVPRHLNPDGYNQEWIWKRLKTDAFEQPSYKVIIWDDINRVDTPTIWYDSAPKP